MNRPPSGPPGDPPPGTPWHLRRPGPDDPTGVARPRSRPAPPPPPPPPSSRPRGGDPPHPPPDIPWYLQRPDRPPPPPPAAPIEPHKADIAAPRSATTDLKRLLPWLFLAVAGVAVAVAVTVLVSTVAHLASIGGAVLDVTKVQAGVLQTLSDPASGYGANTVSDVSCNGGRNPSARQGTTFTCDATVNGAARHVTVLVADDQGTYEIDSPR